MGTHMKTTIEIPDALLAQAKAKAAREKTTLRALVTEGLIRVTSQKPVRRRFKMVTFKGHGLQPEFQGASWEKIRDAIYEGRG
jgi:hypothetical protein